MRLCRAAPAVGLLLLLALGVSCAKVPGVTNPGRLANLFKKLPSDIHGLSPEKLHSINPGDAMTAYQSCKRHGAACKVPCKSISSCAACHPSDEGGKTVCAFCMPGYTLSADQSSCVACKSNTFSAGGRAASCTLCPEGETARVAAAHCISAKGKPKRREADSKRQGSGTNQCAGEGLTLLLGGNFGLPDYGCVADLVNDGNGYLQNQRCVVRVTENPARYDACATSPTYPTTSSTRCTQVSIATAPIPARCSGQNNCTAGQTSGCWVQPWGETIFSFELAGWIQSGPNCDEDIYSYLAPCPYSKCRTAPSCEECKVEADLLMMREAPCSSAPTVKKHGRDLIMPKGASFEYLDRNSRQSESCATYGLLDVPGQTAAYCWVLGSYQGITGWVPVQKLKRDEDGFAASWTSALCSYLPDSEGPQLLVSDDGSATGCAQLTRDLAVTSCFPADATVMLRGGATVRMSQLQLDDEVAVRTAEGSVAWSAVYAFGHRDESTPADFVELAVSAEGAGDATTAIQATPDHFVLVGTDRPTYKRAGSVVVGETLWMVVPGAFQLVPATVTDTRAVTNAGLYAPMTLSGSIIVNNIAASVHSNWFADSAWVALGLPESWLHTLYQAVLAPVRLLWHILPNYEAAYARVEQHFDIAATVPSLTKFAAILAWVLKDAVVQSGLVLAATATTGLVALVTVSASKGPAVRTNRQKIPLVPLFMLTCLALIAMADAARLDGGEGKKARAWIANDNQPQSYIGAANALYDVEQEGKWFSKGDRVELSVGDGHKRRGDDAHREDDYYERRRCGPIDGCCGPPDEHLPHGHWACPDQTVPFGGKCIGVCDGSGFAEATCTPRGWHVSGACYKLAVCRGLPAATVPGNGFWPESCRNTLVGDFCISKCNNQTRCLTFQQAVVRCGVNGWEEVATTALQPYGGVPIGCDVGRCTGQPAAVVSADNWDCSATAVGGFCLTTCFSGFSLNSTCVADETWGPEQGACGPCEDAPDVQIDNGSWPDCSDTPIGSSCPAICTNGGSAETFCEVDGNSAVWGPVQGSCNAP